MKFPSFVPSAIRRYSILFNIKVTDNYKQGRAQVETRYLSIQYATPVWMKSIRSKDPSVGQFECNLFFRVSYHAVMKSVRFRLRFL